jgi:RNA polymerase III RPC4
MNVSEGLSCGFQQQAVVINMENGGEYVPLGPVQRTVVITPNLKGAFQSS